MRRLVGTAFMLGIAAAVIGAPAPARAQFAGGGMEQFAPMLEMMKSRMGKRRYGQLMRTVGPMMADMMDKSGGGFGISGLGGGRGGYGRVSRGFGKYGRGGRSSGKYGRVGRSSQKYGSLRRMGRSFNIRSLRGLGGLSRYGRRYARRSWY